MNRIIFGGAFDPVHNGHINMAENAAKELAGEVIFIPARISVWKDVSAPVEDKIAMLKLAIKDKKNLSIDEYEINSGKDINYSIDTVRHFKEKYPNDKLFFLIGVDQVNEFHRWREAEELANLAQIVFFTRPGYVVKDENINKFHMLEIKGSGIDASSIDIRELKSFELPDEVLFYIVEHDLYAGMVELKKTLSPQRLAHSKSVANLAYEIAKANKLEKPLDAFVAGLLHDLGKDIGRDKQIEIMKNQFPEYVDMPKFAYHQFAGAYLAQAKFGITDKEIIKAIEFHATGNSGMGILGKIIYAADKIEPTRGFDSTDLISAMMNDAETGFKIVLQANKDFLLNTQKSIENPLTYNCFKEYLQ